MHLREQVNTLQAAKAGLEAEIEGLRRLLDRAHTMPAPVPVPVVSTIQNDPDGIIIPNQILGITIPDVMPPSPCRDDYKSVTYWYKCTWNKAQSEQKGISQDGPRRRGGWNLANDVVKVLAFLQHEDGDTISGDEAKAINTDTRLLLSHLLNIGICPITLSDAYNHPRVNTIIVAVLEGKHSCISLCDKNWKAHEVLLTVFSSFKQSNKAEIYEQRMWRRLRPNAANDAKSRRVHMQKEREERERLKRGNSEDAPISRKKQRESSIMPVSISESVQPSASLTSQPVPAHAGSSPPADESMEPTPMSSEPGSSSTFTELIPLSANLVAASIVPAGPVVASTKPVVTSAEPVVVPPAEPVVAPTEPVVVPTKPVVAPAEPVLMPTKPEVASTEPEVTSAKPVVTSAELVAISTGNSGINHSKFLTAWKVLYDYISSDDNAAILTEQVEQILGDSYRYSDWRDAFNLVELDSDDTDYNGAQDKLLALAADHGIMLSDILPAPASKLSSSLLLPGDQAGDLAISQLPAIPVVENILLPMCAHRDGMEFQFNMDLEVAESQTVQPEAAPAGKYFSVTTKTDLNTRVRPRKNRKPLGLLSNENAENQGRPEIVTSTFARVPVLAAQVPVTQKPILVLVR
ncbi:hypothetical protein K488DRAFT_75231, partial [Vararia minispora EC-137]